MHVFIFKNIGFFCNNFNTFPPNIICNMGTEMTEICIHQFVSILMSQFVTLFALDLDHMVNRCPSKFSNKTVPKSENSYKIQNSMLNQIKCVFMTCIKINGCQRSSTYTS